MPKKDNENSVKSEKKLKVVSNFRDRYTFIFYNPGDLFEIDETIKTEKDTQRVDNTNKYKVSKLRYDELLKSKYVKEI